jgi:hypothetical protein
MIQNPTPNEPKIRGAKCGTTEVEEINLGDLFEEKGREKSPAYELSGLTRDSDLGFEEVSMRLKCGGSLRSERTYTYLLRRIKVGKIIRRSRFLWSSVHDASSC